MRGQTPTQKSREGSLTDNRRISGLVLVALHLVPGIGFAVFFFVLSRVFISLGFTAYLALIVAIPVFLVPVEMGVMMWWSRRRLGSRSLRDVIIYRDTGHTADYVLFPIVLLLWLAIASFAVSPISRFLGSVASSWFPEWTSQAALMEGLRGCSPGQRAFTIILAALFSGIAAPVVEELYFRGFLLPRMERSGWAAPVWNSLLFALYHFYFPENVLVIFLSFLPISYVVWRWRNVRVSILTHSIINVWGVIQLFGVLT
jgi:CAAX protease family protein